MTHEAHEAVFSLTATARRSGCVAAITTTRPGRHTRINPQFLSSYLRGLRVFVIVRLRGFVARGQVNVAPDSPRHE